MHRAMPCAEGGRAGAQRRLRGLRVSCQIDRAAPPAPPAATYAEEVSSDATDICADHTVTTPHPMGLQQPEMVHGKEGNERGMSLWRPVKAGFCRAASGPRASRPCGPGPLAIGQRGGRLH